MISKRTHTLEEVLRRSMIHRSSHERILEAKGERNQTAISVRQLDQAVSEACLRIYNKT